MAKVGTATTMKERLQKLLDLGRITEAHLFCEKLKGLEAAWNWPLLGDHYYQTGDYDKALECYQKGIPVVGLARTWSKMGGRSLEKKNNGQAQECYRQAEQAYETLIRDDRCLWDLEWNGEHMETRRKIQLLAEEMGGEEKRDERLQPLLDRASAYCKRLEEMFLFYVCQEEVAETIDIGLKISPLFRPRPLLISGKIVVPPPKKVILKHRFDYQLIHRGKTTIERRRPLTVDSQINLLATSDGDALIISHYRIVKMIYVPLCLFGKGSHLAYRYRILKEKKDNGETSFLVEVLPEIFSSPIVPFGQAWVRENGQVEEVCLNMKSIFYEHLEPKPSKRPAPIRTAATWPTLTSGRLCVRCDLGVVAQAKNAEKCAPSSSRRGSHPPQIRATRTNAIRTTAETTHPIQVARRSVFLFSSSSTISSIISERGS